MRILFVGESWQGSSARGLREALSSDPSVTLADISDEHFLPKHEGVVLRLANRLLRPLQRAELERAISRVAASFKPDVTLIYKGAAVSAPFIAKLQAHSAPVVNVFPDYSPKAYGPRLEQAIAQYDLVISTKPFHPPVWQSLYGYANRCVFVPHGYDPQVHLWTEPPSGFTYDLALCGTWRPEYHALMCSLATELGAEGLSVAIAGSGWPEHKAGLPKSWHVFAPRLGRLYGEFLRSARIVIAPLNRNVVIRNVRHPGDEDTTRTYELAAAHCFFLHQRSDYVVKVYDENSEVPVWTNAGELAQLIRRWLPDEAGRRSMATRAHARAVPAYSTHQNARSIVAHIDDLIRSRKTSGAARDPRLHKLEELAG